MAPGSANLYWSWIYEIHMVMLSRVDPQNRKKKLMIRPVLIAALIAAMALPATAQDTGTPMLQITERPSAEIFKQGRQNSVEFCIDHGEKTRRKAVQYP